MFGGFFRQLRILCAGAALAALAMGTGSAVADDVNRTALTGVAIEGFDPVAYWVDGEPRQGKLAISLEWQGATWRFSSEENRELFLEDPEKYAPAFGGYCAYGVGRGIKADIHPYFWEIDQGKLYLFVSKSARDWWEADKAKMETAAERQWAQLGRSPAQ